MLLLAGISLCYVNILAADWVWFSIGLLPIFIFIFGIPIVKAENCYSGDHLILIGNNEKIKYEQIIEIKELTSSLVYRHIIWSVQETKFYHSIAWDTIKITYMYDETIHSAMFMVDPKKKAKYDQFIQNCKELNPEIIFKLKV